MPRLVFADFLDEQDTDHDSAVAAFIRVGCSLNAKKARQTPAEGKFLHENWHRLLPHLAAAGYTLHRRSGRTVTLTRVDDVPGRLVRDAYGLPREQPGHKLNRWCTIGFWRGFATYVSTYQARDLDAVRLVALSQPLALLTVQDAVYGYGRNSSQFYDSSFLEPLAPANDIYERVRDFDVELVEPHLSGGGFTKIKRFNRLRAFERASAALSNAIRGWVDAQPVATRV